MGKKRSPLSRGESSVLSALWRLDACTLGELHEEVLKFEKMQYATVQSYIRRLEAKGYVKSQKKGRSNVYRPAVKPEKVHGQTIDEMLRKIFSGQSLPIFRHLIQERGLSEEELQQLRSMIDEAEEKQTDEKNSH